MLYPFMTLNDDTEITHSKMQKDGTVKVYFETPTNEGFDSALCKLPGYEWERVDGYTAEQLDTFRKLIEKNAHLILEFSQEGGILNATTA